MRVSSLKFGSAPFMSQPFNPMFQPAQAPAAMPFGAQPAPFAAPMMGMPQQPFAAQPAPFAAPMMGMPQQMPYALNYLA